jgi:hypothetical protein
MAKQSKAEKLIDQRIDRAYGLACSGIQVDIMDLGKIFEVGKVAIARGEDDACLGATLLAYVNTIRKN